MTAQQLAKYFDHTQLKAQTTVADLERLCAEAVKYGFASIMVNPAQIQRCKAILGGADMRIGVVVGFPLGQNTINIKVAEAREAIALGANDIDYVLNVTEVKNGNYAYIEEEMRAITEACHENGAVCKVIIETCFLTDEEKKQVCTVARNVGVDFVKTSSGFGTSGATYEDIVLMKATVGDKVKVKASGGIRSLEKALQMIEAGADRLCATVSAAIMEEFEAQ